jgi:uracil-DNA glycosylase
MALSPKIPKNHREIADKLANILKPTGWYDLLKGFLVSEEFEYIIGALDANVEEGKRFSPTLRNVFSAFIQCPLDQLKVVVLNDEPYQQLGLSDGLAFSCVGTNHKHVDLFQMLRAVNSTVYNDQQELQMIPTYLDRWAQQGVLLLNISLTTEIGKPGKHQSIWDPFVKYLLDMINSNHPALVWIFFGKTVAPLEEILSDHQYKLFCSHPSETPPPALWDCRDVFNAANTALKLEKKKEINW